VKGPKQNWVWAVERIQIFSISIYHVPCNLGCSRLILLLRYTSERVRFRSWIVYAGWNYLERRLLIPACSWAVLKSMEKSSVLFQSGKVWKKNFLA